MMRVRTDEDANAVVWSRMRDGGSPARSEVGQAGRPAMMRIVNRVRLDRIWAPFYCCSWVSVRLQSVRRDHRSRSPLPELTGISIHASLPPSQAASARPPSLEIATLLTNRGPRGLLPLEHRPLFPIVARDAGRGRSVGVGLVQSRSCSRREEKGGTRHSWTCRRRRRDRMALLHVASMRQEFNMTPTQNRERCNWRCKWEGGRCMQAQDSPLYCSWEFHIVLPFLLRWSMCWSPCSRIKDEVSGIYSS